MDTITQARCAMERALRTLESLQADLRDALELDYLPNDLDEASRDYEKAKKNFLALGGEL